ncbi:MAG: hypothetical protein M3X11_11495, partial [Acidobacteriota bacterium]|nr:hypothetical protein [Acidobacteriota bacterium]
MTDIGIGECELFSGHVEPRLQGGPGGGNRPPQGAQVAQGPPPAGGSPAVGPPPQGPPPGPR